MAELVDRVRERIAAYQVREKVAAMVCLTVIAIVAMMRLTDPENVVINVVVAIAAFVAGGGATSRKGDAPPPG